VSPSPPFNFSAATAAASFVGAGNRTFIGCEGFDDAREANKACAGLLGHSRGECYAFPAHENATSVAICKCLAFAGLTPPGNCVDATCVWGANACSVRQWQNYFAIVLDTFSLLITAYVFGFGIYVIVAARKNLKMNSMTVTLVSITLAATFLFLWCMCAFLGYVVLLSRVPLMEVQKPIAVPGLTMCGVIGVLTFPLQWLEVAKKTTRIKATRGGSSKAPYIAVAVAAFVVSAAMIFFAITGQSFLTSGEFPGFEEAGILHTTPLPLQSNAHFSSTHICLNALPSTQL
jgi:hypothetical protein